MVDDILFTLLPAVLLLISALLSVAAGVGLIRFPDVLTKLHAVTKPQVLGLALLLLAIALAVKSWVVLFAVVPVFAFQSLTAPVSAHMVGRAYYRTGRTDHQNLLVDELAPAVALAPEDEDDDSDDDDLEYLEETRTGEIELGAVPGDPER